jgi:hypothetical protein
MSVFTLLIDVDNKQLLSNRFGGVGSFPNFDRGDSPSIEIGFLKYNGIQYDFVDYSASSVKFGIGANAATPSEGQFRLTWNGITSNAITYNSTTAQIQTALAPAVSATVTTISGVDSAWLITMTTEGVFTGTTAGLGGDSFNLYPESSVLINTARNPSANVSMRQIVRLLQKPAAFQDSWANSQTTGGATLTLTQEGSATQSETYSLLIDDSVYAGQYNLIFGNQSVGISFNATADQIQGELAKLTSIGNYLDAGGVTRPNVRVSGDNGKYGIAFVGGLSQTNITTALSLNDSALFRPPYKTAVVTLGTSQIENLLNSGVTGLVLEVEIVENGKSNTVLREDIEFNRNDIIVTGSAIPAEQASYYTKAEADALFVEDSTGNVDATNRRLKNSGGTTIVDYGASLFGASGMVNLSASQVTIGNFPVYINSTVTATGAVSFGGGMAVSGNLGFYGTTPIAKPSGSNLINSVSNLGLLSYSTPTQANIINNLVSAGIFSSSPTYGVLPLSPITITTTASIYFGQVDSNSTNSVSVVVTGCNLNDVVLLGLPANMDNGLAFAGHVTVANGLELDCINATNGNITPATATYRITVIGY